MSRVGTVAGALARRSPTVGIDRSGQASPRRQRARTSPLARLRRLVLDGRLASFLVLIALWELFAKTAGLSPVVMPAPTAVVTSWWDVLLHGGLLSALGFSLEATVIGFGISILLGVPAGLAMGLFRRFRYVLDAYMTILLATPYVAFVPVLIVWTGLGLKTQILAATLFSIPFVVVNTEAGVRDVEATTLSMARSFECRPVHVFAKVVLPGALSSIFVGFRLGMSHGFKGVILAEMIISYAGLGGLVAEYGGAFRTDHLLAAIFTALVSVIVINAVFEFLHRRLLPWRVANRQTA